MAKNEIENKIRKMKIDAQLTLKVADNIQKEINEIEEEIDCKKCLTKTLKSKSYHLEIFAQRFPVFRRKAGERSLMFEILQKIKKILNSCIIIKN